MVFLKRIFVCIYVIVCEVGWVSGFIKLCDKNLVYFFEMLILLKKNGDITILY